MSLRFDGWESVEVWLRGLPELPDGVWTYLTIVDRNATESGGTLAKKARESEDDPLTSTADDLVQWVRDTANGNSLGSAHTVFRVRSWTKVGSSSAGSRQFVVLDENAPDAMDSYLTMNPAQAEQHATAAGLRSVGDHYKQFGDTVLKAVGALADIFTQTASQLNSELNTQRAQALGFFRAQLQDKRETSEQDALIQIHKADTQVKEAALSKGIGMLESVVKALARDVGGTSVPSELEGLVQILGGSPELSKTLRDPKVMELLRQPAAQAGLAEILNDLTSALDPPTTDGPSEETGTATLHAVPDDKPEAVHPSLADDEPEIKIAGEEPDKPTEEP